LVRCPFCSYEGEFKPHKTWGFRFYGVLNHHQGVSPAGRESEFVVRVKPRGVSE